MFINSLDPRVRAYLAILEPNPPAWLDDYIKTAAMQKQHYISTTCGTLYTDLFDSQFFYSSLCHSIGVALIVWHFTKNRRQTLAGLFHDIATPAFKHCVDFMNGDYLVQESTEDLTTEIIKNSQDIMKLLRRDKIPVSSVDNYHLYPIADNDTPKLSADRLEYSLANALFTYHLLGQDDIRALYEDIAVQKDFAGIPELGFKTKALAVKFVAVTSQLSVIYRNNKTRFSMQFIADILKRLQNRGEITLSDLYNLKEQDVIDRIAASPYRDIFATWRAATAVQASPTPPPDVYYVHQPSKVRYIDPLFSGERLSAISEDAKNLIADNLSYRMDDYVYLNFAFPD